MAISGFYVGLYVVFKGLSAAFSSPKKEVGENHGEKRREVVFHIVQFILRGKHVAYLVGR